MHAKKSRLPKEVVALGRYRLYLGYIPRLITCRLQKFTNST